MHDGVDAVEDALVVGGRAVGIELGEARRVDDARDDLVPIHVVGGQHRGGDAAGHANAALVAEVGEDAQADLGVGDLGEAIGHRLGDGVDQVRPHRVAAVDEHVDDDHPVLGAAEDARLDLSRAPAAGHEPRHGAIGQPQESPPRARGRAPQPRRRLRRR